MLFLQESPQISGNLREFSGACHLGILYSSSLLVDMLRYHDVHHLDHVSCVAPLDLSLSRLSLAFLSLVSRLSLALSVTLSLFPLLCVYALSSLSLPLLMFRVR